MNGRNTAARSSRTAALLLRIVGLLSAAVVVGPAPAAAQTADCAALRARIDAAPQGADASRASLAIRQNRAELDRVRAYADDSGCTGGSVFDDPDSPECRALLRRAEELRQTIARLSAGAGQSGDDGDRRAAMEDYNASCTGGGTDAALPTPDALVPVDPDAPAGPASTPAPQSRVARVFCVRHCDGAYYPLADDVRADRLDEMSALCQAQCPNADSSAYAGTADGDVSKAEAADGTSYSALPAAFKFQKATSPTCACRASGESWAQTLARAQTMIEGHKGDVVVTPEIQARMALPQPAPEAKPAAGKPAPVKAGSKRTKAPSPAPPAAIGSEAPNPGEDVTREFRRSVPTL